MSALTSLKYPDSIEATTARTELPRECPRVLVVEDHEDTRFMLRTMLEKRGMSVLEAEDGEAAIELAGRGRPRLILMDAGLPRVDGLAATRRIRAADGVARVPIIFLSGHAEPMTQEAAREAGADDFLVKPIDLDQLAGVLERHLGKISTETLNQDDQGGKAKMSSTVITQQKLFGLLELDAAGTVLYSRVDSGEDAHNFADDIRGLNFYTKVAPFANVSEFRQHLDDFRRGPEQAQTISFTCQYDDGPVQVRILMARIRERSENDRTKSILVHIRKAVTSDEIKTRL